MKENYLFSLKKGSPTFDHSELNRFGIKNKKIQRLGRSEYQLASSPNFPRSALAQQLCVTQVNCKSQ